MRTDKSLAIQATVLLVFCSISFGFWQHSVAAGLWFLNLPLLMLTIYAAYK